MASTNRERWVQYRMRHSARLRELADAGVSHSVLWDAQEEVRREAEREFDKRKQEWDAQIREMRA